MLVFILSQGGGTERVCLLTLGAFLIYLYAKSFLFSHYCYIYLDANSFIHFLFWIFEIFGFPSPNFPILDTTQGGYKSSTSTLMSITTPLLPLHRRIISHRTNPPTATHLIPLLLPPLHLLQLSFVQFGTSSSLSFSLSFQHMSTDHCRVRKGRVCSEGQRVL